MPTWMLNLLLSSVGLGFVLALLGKFLPNEKIAAFGKKLGIALSLLGSSKMGKGAWEKLETFLEGALAAFLEGFKEGLNTDDNGIVPTTPSTVESNIIQEVKDERSDKAKPLDPTL